MGLRKSGTLAGLAVLAAAAIAAAPPPASAWRLSPAGRRALDAVSADSLRGHLSFLASDIVGGRVNGTAGLAGVDPAPGARAPGPWSSSPPGPSPPLRRPGGRGCWGAPPRRPRRPRAW